MSVETVKLMARKIDEEGKKLHYTLTVPRDFIKELGWRKGDKLIARIMELTINGATRKVLIYYKP